MFESLQAYTAFFEDYKVVWSAIYIIGLVLGLWFSTLGDLRFLRYFKRFNLNQSEILKLQTFFINIWIPIALVVIGLFLGFMANPVASVGSPNYVIRSIVAGVILINGIMFYLISGRKLIWSRSFEEETESARDLLRKISFAFSAVSISSWYSLLVLSLIYKIQIGFETLILVYVGVVSLCVMVSQFYEYFFAKDAL